MLGRVETCTREKPVPSCRLPSGRRNIHRSSGSNQQVFQTCQSARISPTISDRLFATGAEASWSSGWPSRPRNAATAGPTARAPPSSTLSAMPSRSGAGRAEEPFGAALGDPAGQGFHQHGVGCAGAADQRRVRAHRVGHAAAAVQLREARERVRHPLQGQREVDDAAAVDRCRYLLLAEIRRRRHLGQHRLLHRVVGQPVAARVPPPGAAERQEPGVLSGAVVPERARRLALGAALELVLLGGRLGEQRPDRADLLRVGQMRRGGDRQLTVVEVGPRTDDRQRLDRLRRRPHERDEPAVARFRDDSAVPDRDRVDGVPSLDDVPAADGYRDRLSHEDGTLSALQ